MATMVWIRAAIAVLVLALSGGCFFSAAPVISPGTGEDVGKVLRYKAYFTKDGPDAGMAWEFRRVTGTTYKLFMVGPDNQTTSYPEGRGKAIIRRAGDRLGEPIYLIEVDMRYQGEGYELYGFFIAGLVAIRPDGVGVHAVMDCSDPGLVRLAEQYALVLTSGSQVSSPYVCDLGLGEGKGDPLGFFVEARRQGLVGWEDEMGVSLFEEIGENL